MQYQNDPKAGLDSTQHPPQTYLPVTPREHSDSFSGPPEEPWPTHNPRTKPVVDVNSDCPSHDDPDVEAQNDRDVVDGSYNEKIQDGEAKPNLRPIFSPAPTSMPDLSLTRAGDNFTYPEGGLQAWLVVFGAFCSLLACLGTMNTIASFQSYFITHQLVNYDAGTIGWIFSVYAALSFFGGVLSGPAFDKYGARWLVLPGSVGICLSMFLIGVCTQYWHFMLVFGVLSGMSTSLIFTPSIAAIGHFFMVRRGFATGLAATGGALGGVIFPLMLESLIPKVGFAWSTRILGFVYVFLCAIACFCIKTRLPPSKTASAKPDFRILRDPRFALSVAAVYLLEWGLFVPITYISSYALSYGFSEKFSYQILVIMNVGSIFGRFIPGFYADAIGRFNTMILTTVLAVVSVLCIWLPLGHTKAGLVIFALMFGFASGSNISLTPVCIGQLCRTTNYGLYYSTCYTIVSVGCLTGIPIVGEILTSNHGNYWGSIVFVGACYGAGLVCFTIVRVMETGWTLNARY